ncbi:MAG: class I SAM-dependent methyltransferase [Siphonobacter sp.]
MASSTHTFIPALGTFWPIQLYEAAIWLGVPEKKIRMYLVQRIDQYPLLDFGCGTGTFLALLQQQTPAGIIRGLDPDPYMIEKCHQKQLVVDRYEGGPLPYENASFGTVTSTWVFQHFSEEECLHYLREIRRILRGNGVFWLGDWGPSSALLQRISERLVTWLDPAQNNFGPSERWPALLEKAGFSDIAPEWTTKTHLGTFYYWKCS